MKRHPYLALHQRQYVPLPVGLIEVWFYRAPGGLRAQLWTTRAINPPPARSMRTTVWMADVNAHWAGKVMGLALAELAAKRDTSEDTQPINRAELSAAMAGACS